MNLLTDSIGGILYSFSNSHCVIFILTSNLLHPRLFYPLGYYLPFLQHFLCNISATAYLWTDNPSFYSYVCLSKHSPPRITYIKLFFESFAVDVLSVFIREHLFVFILQLCYTKSAGNPAEVLLYG